MIIEGTHRLVGPLPHINVKHAYQWVYEKIFGFGIRRALLHQPAEVPRQAVWHGGTLSSMHFLRGIQS